MVIGNPPYIRAEELKGQSAFFKNNFQVFTRGADIYYYFYERTKDLLKNNGFICFINNTYEKTAAGKTLRKFVINNFNILKYINYTLVNIFDEATTYPIVMLASKSDHKSIFQYLKITKEELKFNFEFYTNC